MCVGMMNQGGDSRSWELVQEDSGMAWGAGDLGREQAGGSVPGSFCSTPLAHPRRSESKSNETLHLREKLWFREMMELRL